MMLPEQILEGPCLESLGSVMRLDEQDLLRMDDLPVVAVLERHTVLTWKSEARFFERQVHQEVVTAGGYRQ